MSEIATNWNMAEKGETIATWDRSYQSNESTGYGTDFSITISMERITCDSQGNKLGSKNIRTVTRKFSSVISDPDVQQYAMLKAKLVKKWYDEDLQADIESAEIQRKVEEEKAASAT